MIKLISKERIEGKIHCKYDTPKTPYQRLMKSKEIPEKAKRKLQQIYISLNPVQLKRTIDKKLDLLYKTYQEKQKSQKVKPFKKLKPISVRKYIAQQELISVR